MAVQIQESLFTGKNGVSVIVLNVDTVTDLPDTDVFEDDWGITLGCGSIAYVVDDGTQYKMQSDGTWTLMDDSPFSNVYTKTETDNAITDAIEVLDAPSVGGTGAYIMRISETDGIITATVGTIDSVPASGSDNPISSDAVYTAISDYSSSQITGTNLNASATNPVDLNDLTTTGVYRSTAAANASYISHLPNDLQPGNDPRGFKLIVYITSNDSYAVQELYPAYNANVADQYYRRHYRGTGTGQQQGWSNWYLYAGTDTGS